MVQKEDVLSGQISLFPNEPKLEKPIKDHQGTRRQYLLVINPSREVSSDVRKMKEEVKQALDRPFRSYNSKPHITLWLIKMSDAYEHKLLEVLENECRSIAPFKINLNGFGSFTLGPNVIFVQPNSTEKIISVPQRLFKELRKVVSIPNTSKPFLTNHPHMTVASGLSSTEFNSLWSTFQGRSYSGSFMAKSVVLLEKRQPPFRWIGEFYFGQ